MKNIRFYFALLGIIGFTFTAAANVISVNFMTSPTNHPNQRISYFWQAGVYPVPHWNSVPSNKSDNTNYNPTNSASGTYIELLDNTDTATTAAISWLAGGTGGDDLANPHAVQGIGDGKVVRGYLDDSVSSPAGNGVEINVTGIPYGTYTAVILFSTDTEGGTYLPATINGGSYSPTGDKNRYNEINNWQEYNTIVAPDLSGDLSITLPPQDGLNRGTVAGIQIASSDEGAPPPFLPQPGPYTLPDLSGTTAISINFTHVNANEQIGPETTAGIGNHANWNITSGKEGSKGSLVDSDGTDTGATITWISSVTYADGSADGDASAGIGDAQIRLGYLDDGEWGGYWDTGADFSVTSIPYENYIAILYMSTDADGGNYLPFLINGNTYVNWGTKSTYGTSSIWDDSNVIVASNLTGDLIVDSPGKSGSDRGSIAGVQIVEIPYVPDGPVTVSIANFVSDGSGVEISWPSQEGKLYGVETNSNLITANWITFRTGIAGDGGLITVTNDIGPDQIFYRVISE